MFYLSEHMSELSYNGYTNMQKKTSFIRLKYNLQNKYGL